MDRNEFLTKLRAELTKTVRADYQPDGEGDPPGDLTQLLSEVEADLSEIQTIGEAIEFIRQNGWGVHGLLDLFLSILLPDLTKEDLGLIIDSGWD